MKKITTIIFGIILFTKGITVYAKKPEIKNSWIKFQDAIQKNDTSTVASMSQFPLISNEFGDKKSKIKNREQFIKIYNKIFTAHIKSCIKYGELKYKGKPRPYYSLFCDPGELNNELPLQLKFTVSNGQFLLTEIDNVNE